MKGQLNSRLEKEKRTRLSSNAICVPTILRTSRPKKREGDNDQKTGSREEGARKKAQRRLGIGGVKWTECGCGSAQPAVVKAPTARDWLPNLHLLSQLWPITASITLTNRDLIARSRLLFAAPIAPVPLRLSLPPRKESSFLESLGFLQPGECDACEVPSEVLRSSLCSFR